MSKYLKFLNCSIKFHRCIKALDALSVVFTSMLSVLALIKAYSNFVNKP